MKSRKRLWTGDTERSSLFSIEKGSLFQEHSCQLATAVIIVVCSSAIFQCQALYVSSIEPEIGGHCWPCVAVIKWRHVDWTPALKQSSLGWRRAALWYCFISAAEVVSSLMFYHKNNAWIQITGGLVIRLEEIRVVQLSPRSVNERLVKTTFFNTWITDRSHHTDVDRGAAAPVSLNYDSLCVFFFSFFLLNMNKPSALKHSHIHFHPENILKCFLLKIMLQIFRSGQIPRADPNRQELKLVVGREFISSCNHFGWRLIILKVKCLNELVYSSPVSFIINMWRFYLLISHKMTATPFKISPWATHSKC